MIRSINKPLLALLMVLGASPLALAQQSTPPPTQGDSSMHAFQDTPQANTTAPTQKAATPPKPGDPNCIRNTGSMIPAKHGGCLPVPGRSYSRDDIQRTGSPTLGPALRQLDPSVTVSGGH